jgi:hypothetical protein
MGLNLFVSIFNQKIAQSSKLKAKSKPILMLRGPPTLEGHEGLAGNKSVFPLFGVIDPHSLVSVPEASAQVLRD